MTPGNVTSSLRTCSHAEIRTRGRVDLKQLPDAHQRVLSEVSGLLRANRAQGYIVGGFLRDHLLGKLTSDIDLVVAGIEPVDVARHLTRALHLSRPVVFARFKTVLVAGEGIQVEICRLQGDLGHDATRRDFTVNCFYADVRAAASAGFHLQILDPTRQAFEDMRTRRLRTPRDSCFTLWLDPLRILRAVRFYATGGLWIDSPLLNAMERMVYLLTRVSAERTRMELEKILVSPRLVSALGLMQRTGIAEMVLPELAGTYGFSQKTPYHTYDLFRHLVRTASYVPPEVSLRLAALLHDLGKLSTQAAKEDRMVYYGHEKVSAETAVLIMKRLRFSNQQIRLVSFLIANHMINYSNAWSDKAVRRFARKVGKNLSHMLQLGEADRRARGREVTGEVTLRDLSRRIVMLEKERGPGRELPVNGRDIMTILGIDEGPLVGEAKEFLYEEALKRRWRMTKLQAGDVLRKWAGARASRRPKP